MVMFTSDTISNLELKSKAIFCSVLFWFSAVSMLNFLQTKLLKT